MTKETIGRTTDGTPIIRDTGDQWLLQEHLYRRCDDKITGMKEVIRYACPHCGQIIRITIEEAKE